jgi:parallel beta-helix repeat protein
MCLVVLVAACGAPRRPALRATPENLDELLQAGLAPDTVLYLEAGDYVLTPRPMTDVVHDGPSGIARPLSTTVGLLVDVPGVEIRGAGMGRTVLHTRAAYGVLFEDVPGGVLSGVTVTDGVRPADPRVRAAGVVIRGQSEVRIRSCRVTGNLGEPEVVEEIVEGIMGIDIRDSARAWIHDNEILDNSWNGISLHGTSQAFVENNVVDGVSSGHGGTGGRGVGISVEDDATAIVHHNYVTRYWKGIGVFGSPTAVVRENIVEHMRTWGLTVWNAGDGVPQARFERNLVYDVGACGASITLTKPGSQGGFRGNLLWKTGQDATYDGNQAFCEQCALALHAVVDGFVVEDNLAYLSREADDAPARDDVGEAEFQARLDDLKARFERWSALQQASIFAADRHPPVPPTP